MMTKVGLLAAILLMAASASAKDDGTTGSDTRPVLKVQLGHSLVDSVVFSPDGAHVLTGSADNTAKLWETATGREVRSFKGPSAVTSVAFSPDGVHVLTGSADNTARLWNTATGREVRSYQGHRDVVTSVAFSPDGAHMLTGSHDESARLWVTATGREVRSFLGHGDRVRSVAFSPDGAHVLTGSHDKTARLWETESGREIRSFRGHVEYVTSVAFSPDGAHVLTGSWDKTARLWETATGRDVRSFQGHGDIVDSVAFSPDGARVLTGSWDNTTRLWETATGRETRTFQGHEHVIRSVAFSPDGAHVLTGSWDTTTRLWETATGQEVRSFQGHSDPVSSVALSSDGAHMLTGSWDKTARLWETTTGREVRSFAGHDVMVTSIAFSPDGAHLLTVAKTARLWETATGQEVRSFQGHGSFSVGSAAFSPDAAHVLTGSGDKTALLWETATGRQIRSFKGHSEYVTSVAFSPDGAHVLTGSVDKTARLWDTATGQEVRSFQGHGDIVDSVAFSPDGAHVLTGSNDGTARLWETVTGREVRSFQGHERGVESVSFSPDGAHVLTSSSDETARLWETATGREVRSFRGHDHLVSSAAFSPDGAHVLTGSWDKTTRLWKTETGRELCARVRFGDGSWVVFDPEGRYDASNGGDVEGVHFVVGMETIALSQLKERAYDPGLWAKHVGYSDEPLLDVSGFDKIALFPAVEVTPPVSDGRLQVALTNRGGGIGRVTILINGKEIEADARGAGFDADAKDASLEIALRDHPSIRPGEKNTIEVVSWNQEGYLSSPRGMKFEYKAPGEQQTDPPQLWAIVCGVSDYRGAKLDLKFAAKDAEDFAQALRLGASSLFGADRAHIKVLSTSGADGATRPTRQGVLDAFAWAKAAKPDDLLIIYLAGHGVSRAGDGGDFHYLLESAASSDLTDPEVRRQNSLSSQELTELIKKIPASKRQVLILDTCASGRVIEKLTESRSVPGSQVRALDRVKDRTGMFVLAGCAADSVSFEASRFGQGLLTYSLLLGMRGGALREDEFVDVERLFGFAADRVPMLAKDVGGIQRPVIATPYGGSSFDIGRVPADMRKDIPLQNVKPVFVRPTFTDRRSRSVHELVAATSAVFRDETAARGTTPLVFVDAARMPDAYELSGQYTVADGTAKVKAFIWLGEKEVATFEVQGPASDFDALARAIVKQARERISR